MSSKARKKSGPRFGEKLVEAFQEMEAYLRGEDTGAEVEELGDDVLTFDRIKAIRRSVAPSTKEFERLFGIKARTMEAYESGRRAPDAATTFVLRMIANEPEAVRRVIAS